MEPVRTISDGFDQPISPKPLQVVASGFRGKAKFWDEVFKGYRASPTRLVCNEFQNFLLCHHHIAILRIICPQTTEDVMKEQNLDS